MKVNGLKRKLVMLSFVSLLGLSLTSCTNPFEHLSVREPGESVSDRGDEPDSGGSKVTDSEKDTGIQDTTKYELDGICYELDPNTKTATVIGAMDGTQSLTIYSSFFASGVEYQVSEIVEGAFQNNQQLHDVTVYQVNSIPANAFRNCSNLVHVTVSDAKLTSIGDYAFYQCTSLTVLDLDCINLNTIGSGAFSKCYRLSLIQNGTNLPLSIGSTDYGGIAFFARSLSYSQHGSIQYEGMDYLVYFRYTDNAYYFEGYYDSGFSFSDTGNVKINVISSYAFYHQTNLNQVVFTQNDILSVMDHAFSHCASLDSLELGLALQVIGESAFEYCYLLTSLKLPESLVSIGDYAFSHCDSLHTLNYLGTVEQWNAVEKGAYWFGSISKIVCQDGEVDV